MIERKDPIPPGRYWLWVKNIGLDGGAQAEAFLAWVVAQNTAEAEYAQSADRPVQILSTEEGDKNGMAFMIFRVLRPVPRWPVAAGLGFPSIARDSVKSQTDVLPESPAEHPGSAMDQVTGALKVIGFGAIAAYLLGKLITRK